MKNRKRAAIFKLFLPAFLALMPLLLLGGGINGSAQAGAPISANQPSSKADSLVLRVYFRDAAERDRLATELAAEEAPITGGFLTVWTDRATYNDLIARGLRVEIDEKQTKEANTPIIWGNTFYGGYRTVEEMQTFLDQKVAQYPTLAEKVDIGDSWCKTHPGQCTQPNSWNGFDLYVMHITNQAIPGPKPVFWFDAGIHSREIATPEVAMNYIAWLLDNYNTNADARWLVDYQDIWVMPMLNPDGHHMNESAGEGTPTTHRKNADKDDGCPSYDLFGTDINRNFPFKWGCCGGSSGNACDQTYRGPAPESEEETIAMMAKVRTLIPDQRGPLDTDMAPITTTGALVNMHSNAQLNIHPWGWTTVPAPNYDEMNNIGRRMGASIAYGGNGYRSCQSLDPNCLYTVDGDEKNWAYGDLGIPAYSVEVHGSGFFPTFAYTRDNIWPTNRGAMIYTAKIARTPYLQTRGPDANTDAATPITVTVGTSAAITASIKYDWPANIFNQTNRYLQNVAAAEFYVDTPPWNGGTPIAMTATDGAFDEQTEAVEGTLPTGSLTPGRHVIFVRGRGVNDYEGYQSWGPIGGVFVDVQAGGSVTPTPPTSTPVPPTITSTQVPPTNTVEPPTNTAVPPTSTSVLPTATPCGSGTCAFVPGVADIGNHCDDCVTGITLPFPFQFYGQTYSSANVSSNGNVQFTGGQPGSVTTCLPTTAFGATIFPHWEDTRTDCSGCGVFTSLSGSAPNRIFNIEWRTGYFAFAGSANFEVRLYEGSPNGQFQLVYGLVTDMGRGATVGAQNDNGTQFWQYACGNANLYEGLCITQPTPPCATVTPVPPTATATATSQPSTSTSTSTSIATSTSTSTSVPPTPCTIQFSDVPSNNTFYANIRCLACRGIISGYSDGTFRPNNQVTRGQLAKIVSNSAGFSEPPTQQTFEDVSPANTFYEWIERLTTRGYMTGYNCGSVGEPCTTGRPYFRPFANATRGQTAKIVSNAAMFIEPPVGQTFEDVPSTHTFYEFIQRLASRNVMQGYNCGSVGEPCTTGKPYFRPGNDVTRGQSAKIVANTFYPDCVTP